MSDPNDPFKPMQAASAPGDQPAMLDTGIAQGKPRKNLMMVGMALAIALVMAWMLWPQSQYTKKPPVVAPQGADAGSGAPNMGAQLMQQLQSQAGGPAPAASKAAPAEAACA